MGAPLALLEAAPKREIRARRRRDGIERCYRTRARGGIAWGVCRNRPRRRFHRAGADRGSGRHEKCSAEWGANKLRQFAFPGHSKGRRQNSLPGGSMRVDTPGGDPYTPAHTDGGDAAADGGPVRL